MATLNDFRLLPPKGAAPARAVIFLHGLGDHGEGGMLEIGRLWQEALPDCVFLCPDAPFPFDMAPPEFYGRQWFSLQNFSAEERLVGTEKAAPILNDYIDQILATYKLTPRQLFLVGFSQGTMMALYTAPRRPEALAGVIGYSGMLIAGTALNTEKRSAPPVLLVHGTRDPIVPFAAMAEAEQQLQQAAIPVTSLACRCDHTIDENGLRAGLDFILRHSPATTAS